MPGIHLSQEEKSLKSWWDESDTFTFPVLRKLQVEGTPGIRGVQNLTVDFNFPVTVISGPNGSGKTTILALAALAYHSQQGHYPIASINGEYYTFSDFFFKGPDDPDISGLYLSWTYRGSDKKEFPLEVNKKSAKKWMHYERRPKRPCNYIGTTIAIPAMEQGVLRNHFQASFSGKRAILNQEYINYLSEIMGKPYSDTALLKSSRLSLRSCKSGNSKYSSFNMGLGEDKVINLLFLLQETPSESLVAIEEIETGLHPAALIKLSKILIKISKAKKIQFIITSHSSHFIDSLPRIARVLVQKSGNIHIITQAPTTRLALSYLIDSNQPEIDIYCEDHVASNLIRRSLGQHAKRATIIPVGAKQYLAQQLAAHKIGGAKTKAIAVWDGDVTKKEVDSWLKEINQKYSNIDTKKFNAIKLPGGIAPEKWIRQMLRTNAGVDALVELGCSPEEVPSIIDRMEANMEHHNIFHQLYEITGQPSEICMDTICKAAIKTYPEFSTKINSALTNLLEDQQVFDVE